MWSGRTTNIVQMLACRQVTGHFPVPVTQLLSTLSQARIQRYHSAATSEIPALPAQPSCEHTCKKLINLSGGRLVALTITGQCLVWSERSGTWSCISLEPFEPGPYPAVISFVIEVVVLPDNRIALIDWHQKYETDYIGFDGIVLWTERYNGWKFKVIDSYKDNRFGCVHNTLNTLTCLPDGELLFLLNSYLWAMTEHNDEWSAIQLTYVHITDIAVLPDGRFITRHRLDPQSQTNLANVLSVWTKTEGFWLANVIYTGDIMSWTFIVDTRFSIFTNTARFFLEEINDEWKLTCSLKGD